MVPSVSVFNSRKDGSGFSLTLVKLKTLETKRSQVHVPVIAKQGNGHDGNG